MDNIESLLCLFQMHAIIIVIYVNFLYYLGYHIRNKQKKNQGPLPCANTMAHGKGTNLCRVPGTGGTRQTSPATSGSHAKKFAVGQPGHTAKPLPCARYIAQGKGAPATSASQPCKKVCRGSARAHSKAFAVCPIYCTRQRGPLPTAVCRVPFAVCGTRQTFCRGLLGLCRVPLAHGQKGCLP